MLLGKLLALDLPLEHEGRIHQAIDHEQKTLLNHTHENPGMDLARDMYLLLPRAMDLSLLVLGLEIFLDIGMYLNQRTLLKQLDHLPTYVIMQLAQEEAILLTLPLKRQNQLHRLHSQLKQLDQWLKLLLLQRFSSDCLSSRVNSVSSHWISIPIFSYHP